MSCGRRQRGPARSRWFKGNLHTHTLNSDGDSTPDEVVRWYREHGYDFLVLTDHNFITEVDGLNAVQGARQVPGGARRRGHQPRRRQADSREWLRPRRLVDPPNASTVVTMVQGMVDGIRAASGVPSVNHPNFGWAISADELASVQRTKLFELYNGHPLVNNVGGGGVPGLEEVWDRLLSSGKLLYGIAVDDAHHFKRPWDPDRIVARSRVGLCAKRGARAAAAGRGPGARGLLLVHRGRSRRGGRWRPNRLRVSVTQAGTSKYRIQFIGRGGRVLQEVAAAEGTYTFKGDEGYVRAKVLESNGAVAWTQPVGVGAQAPR